MRLKIKVATIILLISPVGVQAAGFDCSLKGLNETEKLICQTPYLSGIDNVANKLFITAMDNTLSKGTVKRSQASWLKERNACHKNANCVKNVYLRRNADLSNITEFKPVSYLFPSTLIDEPFEHEMVNDNGFIIKDNAWYIKKLFNEHQKEIDLNLPSADWNLLSHIVINNDLAFIFEATTKDAVYLVLISDAEAGSYVIASYNIDDKNSPSIEVVSKESNALNYVVTGVYNIIKNKQLSNYYKVEVVGGKLTEPVKTPSSIVNVEKKIWTGYCGDQSCESVLLSTDGKWRLASGDDKIKYLNDGVYYFPHDRPDLGINVFITGVEEEEDGWSYFRNYSWGDKDTFFFDNDGAMACIWRTDINRKITERILPVEGLKQPYYISYAGEDYIVSRYIPIREGDGNMAGFYVSKSIRQ